ncbi:hypothetical protein EYF80_060509 [Liparis tanakae]|uniref:Uncharacterized protein n=1 Tax=Liparis tanakae TaxID=230148 RepID=A0A4Z2EKK6_9TELE|nr:hypothetical protein EYF80_060509 [Liparis tanakae]
MCTDVIKAEPVFIQRLSAVTTLQPQHRCRAFTTDEWRRGRSSPLCSDSQQANRPQASIDVPTGQQASGLHPCAYRPQASIHVPTGLRPPSMCLQASGLHPCAYRPQASIHVPTGLRPQASIDVPTALKGPQKGRRTMTSRSQHAAASWMKEHEVHV